MSKNHKIEESNSSWVKSKTDKQFSHSAVFGDYRFDFIYDRLVLSLNNTLIKRKGSARAFY